jgi:hypothetical protein
MDSDGEAGDNVIPFPGSSDHAGDQANDGETCDDEGVDCNEWRALLLQQRKALLANFLRGAISLSEYKSLIPVHNQAVELYKIACADEFADELKLDP